MNIKILLIEEMRRAIDIMESKPGVMSMQKLEGAWMEHDRDMTELFHLFLAIRRHSVSLEKGIK